MMLYTYLKRPKFHRILVTIFLLLILLSIYGLFLGASKDKESIHARTGFLDLSTLHFSSDNAVYLGGEWAFYYNEYIDPAGSTALPDGFIEVPKIWNSFLYEGESIGPHAYGSYRLTVKLSDDSQDILGLKLPSMSSSYKLYINGKLIHQSGIPGISKETETPEWKPNIAFFAPDSSDIDIVIHVSNFHYAKGGMWGNILFGSKEDVVEYRDTSLMRSYLLFGILSITCIFLLSLSLIEKNFPCLYLGLFCLSSALREVAVREVAIWNILGHIDHIMLARLEYITMPLITLFHTIFIYNLYQREFGKKVYRGISISMVAMIPFTLFATPNTFSSYLWVYQLSVLISFSYSAFIITKSFIRNNTSSGILLIGLIVMLLAIVNDILYAEKINTNYGLAHAYTIAFTIFLMTQVFMVFINISENYKRAQLATRSQFMLLQSQIKPHFLFNILNTIQQLVDKNPAKSKKLISVLSDYLRGNFTYGSNPDINLILLRDELTLVESCVYMANTRFDDRIELELDVDSQCLEHKIPSLILQPLVENSIKHGLTEGNLKILITAKMSPKNLIINVRDDGVGMSKIQIHNLLESKTQDLQHLSEDGVGLKNVRMRMQLLYNRDIAIQSEKGQGTEVSLIIPLDNDNKLQEAVEC